MPPGHRRAVEALEPRQLLSAATPETHRFASVDGFTPAQIRHAYGFDQVQFDGSGQTIAIVDAFDSPTIVADLHTFDTQFNLPDPVLNKFNQNGRRARGIQSDRGWASEIALDVEWAHAIAPGATIDLIESNSDSTDDLLAGVLAARKMPGVSVISLSWANDETPDETADDADFLTPRGHSGITVLAAAGDEGNAPAEWPATSPYVIGVGGTSLSLTRGGNYSSESVWSDTTGGVSPYESAPSCQVGLTGTTARSTPDVAYNADPNTGFAVFDQYGDRGWTVLGGTSAGVPQWAALIALANQQRVSHGGLPLDGPTQTLPALYTVASSASYTAAYNDVTVGSDTSGDGSGSGGGSGSGHLGAADATTASPAVVSTSVSTANAESSPAMAQTASTSGSASVGYDDVTGLGTPRANVLVNALANYTARTGRRRRHTATTVATPTVLTRARHKVARPGDPGPVVVGPATASSGPMPRTMNLRPLNFSSEVPVNYVLTRASQPTRLNQIEQASSILKPISIFNFVGTDQSAAPSEAPPPAPSSVETVLAKAAIVALQSTAAPDPVTAPTPGASSDSERFTFIPFDVTATFGDALCLFAHESTRQFLPMVGSVIVTKRFGSLRAWAITAGVLGFDAILVGRWVRRRGKNEKRTYDRGPFAVTSPSAMVDDPDEYYGMT